MRIWLFKFELDFYLFFPRCPNLQYFSLPSTCITYNQFCKAIGELHSLKGMAVDESLYQLRSPPPHVSVLPRLCGTEGVCFVR
jgi:hypothetical protein